MNCKRCGSKIEKGNYFCSRCGRSVGTITEIEEYIREENKKKKLRNMIIVLSVLVVCGVGYTVFSHMTGGNKMAIEDMQTVEPTQTPELQTQMPALVDEETEMAETSEPTMEATAEPTTAPTAVPTKTPKKTPKPTTAPKKNTETSKSKSTPTPTTAPSGTLTPAETAKQEEPVVRDWINTVPTSGSAPTETKPVTTAKPANTTKPKVTLHPTDKDISEDDSENLSEGKVN